jgi:hypothetical protein
VSECPYRVGQMVRLANPRELADVVWHAAAGPTDPNAALAVELADPWPDDKPEVRVLQTAPDLDGWYLIVASPRLNSGDDFGVQHTDVEPVPDA